MKLPLSRNKGEKVSYIVEVGARTEKNFDAWRTANSMIHEIAGMMSISAGIEDEVQYTRFRVEREEDAKRIVDKLRKDPRLNLTYCHYFDEKE